MVSLFGGTIQVQSRKGYGSEFWFTFKAKVGKSKVRVGTDQRIKKLQRAADVLLIDDNAVNLQIASEILVKAGANVETASSGFEALKLCRTKIYEVIIMDIQMPDMDGLVTTEKLQKELHIKTPIIAMTAYGEDKEFYKHGFQSYIAKPIDPLELIETVEKWINTDLRRTPSKEDLIRKEQVINKKVIDKLVSYGGIDMIYQALQDFSEELVVQLKTLQILLRSKQYQKASDILHTIKGNAGTLGIDQIARWAEYMETVSKMKKYTSFEGDLNKFNLLFKSFQEEAKLLIV